MFWREWNNSLRGLVRSFGYALQGLRICLSGRNFRIQTVAGLYALLLGVWMPLTPPQWAILLLTIGLVLGLEALNTGVEAAVNLVSPDYHPLAKRAKDCAATGVLVAALTSVGVGWQLFWQPDRLLALVGWWSSSYIRIIAGLAVLLLSLWYSLIDPRFLHKKSGTGMACGPKERN